MALTSGDRKHYLALQFKAERTKWHDGKALSLFHAFLQVATM